jgi:hypothetical protein
MRSVEHALAASLDRVRDVPGTLLFFRKYEI